MLELLGIVGPPALGKAINSVTGIVDRIGEGARESQRMAHEERLADKAAGQAYFEAMHREENGQESLFSRTMCHLYLVFGYTMAAFILFCCYLQWEYGWEHYLIDIKDPDEAGKTLSLFGIIEWNWGTGKIQRLSPLGLAYLGYATLSFIITLTATNERRRSK